MSKGLSLYQKVIMDLIKERKELTILQIAEIVVRLRLKKRGNNFDPYYSAVEDIPQDQAIYRMMKSLEKRGLVARLLHRRPAIWFYVSWRNNEPELTTAEYGVLMEYEGVMDRDGCVIISTNGQHWKFSRKYKLLPATR